MKTVKIELTYEELQIIEGAITTCLPSVKRHHPELRNGEEDDLYNVWERIVDASTEFFK